MIIRNAVASAAHHRRLAAEQADGDAERAAFWRAQRAAQEKIEASPFYKIAHYQDDDRLARITKRRGELDADRDRLTAARDAALAKRDEAAAAVTAAEQSFAVGSGSLEAIEPARKALAKAEAAVMPAENAIGDVARALAHLDEVEAETVRTVKAERLEKLRAETKRMVNELDALLVKAEALNARIADADYFHPQLAGQPASHTVPAFGGGLGQHNQLGPWREQLRIVGILD